MKKSELKQIIKEVLKSNNRDINTIRQNIKLFISQNKNLPINETGTEIALKNFVLGLREILPIYEEINDKDKTLKIIIDKLSSVNIYDLNRKDNRNILNLSKKIVHDLSHGTKNDINYILGWAIYAVVVHLVDESVDVEDVEDGEEDENDKENSSKSSSEDEDEFGSEEEVEREKMTSLFFKNDCIESLKKLNRIIDLYISIPYNLDTPDKTPSGGENLWWFKKSKEPNLNIRGWEAEPYSKLSSAIANNLNQLKDKYKLSWDTAKSNPEYAFLEKVDNEITKAIVNKKYNEVIDILKKNNLYNKYLYTLELNEQFIRMAKLAGLLKTK